MTKSQSPLFYMRKKTKANLLKSGITQYYRLSPFIFNIVLEAQAREIWQKKEIIGIPIEKEGKLSIFGDDIILYIVGTTYSTIKLLGKLNSFHKVRWYKVNLETSEAFSYIKYNNKYIKKRLYIHLHTQ